MTATDIPEPVRSTLVQMAKLYLLVGEKSSEEHALEELVEAVNRGVVMTNGDSIFHTYNAGPQGPVWDCAAWKRMLIEARELDIQKRSG